MRSAGTKAPKLRFKIGQRIEYGGVRYEVDGAYRLSENPHEWIYRLVDMTPLVQRESTAKLEEAAQMLAPHIERVVYEPFRSSWDAGQYFWDIPARAGYRSDIFHCGNKKLIQNGRPL